MGAHSERMGLGTMKQSSRQRVSPLGGSRRKQSKGSRDYLKTKRSTLNAWHESAKCSEAARSLLLSGLLPKPCAEKCGLSDSCSRMVQPVLGTCQNLAALVEAVRGYRSEEHTSELQSHHDLV